MKNVVTSLSILLWLVLYPVITQGAILVNGVDQSGGDPHFVALPSCAGITDGVCYNLTDHKMYQWNGLAVVEFTGTGDNLGTSTYETVCELWGSGTGFLMTDGTIKAESAISITTDQITDLPAYLDYADIVALWGDGTGLLKTDGTVDTTSYQPASGGVLTGTHDFGGAVVEIPNGASGTTDATGEMYLDTNGDGGTNFSGETVQLYTGAANKYLFPMALPLSASQDNYIPKYDAATKTIQWEADANSGSATAFNDIGDATAAGSIALAGYMQTITSTLNSAGANITLTNTTADLTADVSFIDFKLTDTADANGYFLRGYDNVSNLKWYIGPGGVFYGNGFESLAADGEHYYAAINTTSITATATAGRVSYYNGYHYIADGADWNDYLMSKERMDTFAELDTIVADKALVNKADGAVWLGIHDFGGATVEIPNSDDPDIGAVGQVALDTDGWLRVYNGSIQYGKSLTETIHVTVIAPNDLADASRDAFVVWKNTSGMNFVITHWYAEAGTDNTTLNIETTDATGGTNATVDAVEIATDGTAIFTADDGTITAATIADGSRLLLDFDDTDAPTYVKMSIVGYYNGDVN